jgi:hypothetical protein
MVFERDTIDELELARIPFMREDATTQRPCGTQLIVLLAQVVHDRLVPQLQLPPGP